MRRRAILPSAPDSAAGRDRGTVKALAGQGAIAIWNDVEAGADEAFLRWHNGEHIPERVSIDGFLRGRRWRATGDGTAYFTLYEVRDASVLASPAYLARLNAPTLATATMMPLMPNAARVLCRVAFSLGRAMGGAGATVRLSEIPDEPTVARLAARARRMLAAEPHVLGVHLCLRDDEASGKEIAEARLRKAAPAIPAGVLLVEGSKSGRVEAAAAELAAQLAGAGPAHGYQLEICLESER